MCVCMSSHEGVSVCFCVLDNTWWYHFGLKKIRENKAIYFFCDPPSSWFEKRSKCILSNDNVLRTSRWLLRRAFIWVYKLGCVCWNLDTFFIFISCVCLCICTCHVTHSLEKNSEAEMILWEWISEINSNMTGSLEGESIFLNMNQYFCNVLFTLVARKAPRTSKCSCPNLRICDFIILCGKHDFVNVT